MRMVKMCAHRGGSSLEAGIVTVCGENPLLVRAAAKFSLFPILDISFRFFSSFTFGIVRSCRTSNFWYLDCALELTTYWRGWLLHPLYEMKRVLPYID